MLRAVLLGTGSPPPNPLASPRCYDLRESKRRTTPP